MTDLSILISTDDNRTQAYGYDASYYKSEAERNGNLVDDLEKASEDFQKHVISVTVTEVEDGEAPEAKAYKTIDEVIKRFKPIDTTK